ncbi:MAG TPA: RNA 2',3'-cyclic phosphodiesterase [Vicinamibacterales bacterium]
MRLFLALDLDGETRDAVSREQRRLRERLAGQSLRWVRPEHLHITIVFLGEIDAARADVVIATVAEPVSRDPFEVVVAGGGVFPLRGSPRALWLGLAAGAEQLSAIQHLMATRFVERGLQPNVGPFTPHLTVARWKHSRHAGRVSSGLFDDSRLRLRVPVDHLTLYESRLSSDGPTYLERARATLIST